MPRAHRLVIPGVPLHITQRGVDRRPMFRTPEDFGFLRWVLAEVSQKVVCAIHAYVFMPNHFHLLATPHEPTSAARLMRTVGSRYVRFFNRRYGRTGALWEGRYWSSVVGPASYVLACSRYIDLNPVRAALVAQPGDYDWSSFRHNALGRPDPVITPAADYLALGAHPAARRAAYLALFDAEVTSESTAMIRSASRTWATPTPRADRSASAAAPDDAWPWL